VTWWEDLPIGVQVAVVVPACVLLVWGVHVWFLGQPLSRGFLYGVFWGLLLAGAIMGSIRAERARRRVGEAAAPPAPGGEPMRRPPGGGDRPR
jgi:hypothetical protein